MATSKNFSLSTTLETLHKLERQSFKWLNFLLGRFEGDASDESLFSAYAAYAGDRKEIETVYHDLAVIRQAIATASSVWGNMTEARWTAYLFAMAATADLDVYRQEAWIRLRDDLC